MRATVRTYCITVVVMFALSLAAGQAMAQCVYGNPQISVLPASSSPLVAGTTATYTVSVTNKNSAGCSPTMFFVRAAAPGTLPNGWTFAVTPLSFQLASGATGSAQLQAASPTSAPNGTYVIGITANEYPKFQYMNSTTANYVVNSALPDFTISATPPSITVQQGSSTGVTVSTTAMGGFNSTVSLSSTAPSGVTANFISTSIPGGTGSTTLTFAAASNAPAGTMQVTVTGMGGGQTHTANVSVTVTLGAPVQTGLFISPADPTVAVGTPQAFLASAVYSNNSTVNVTSQANWTSSNPAVAQIGAATGVATTLSVGTTTIGASYGGFSTSTLLTVNAPVTCTHEPPALQVSPTASNSVSAGTPVTFNITLTDQDVGPCTLTTFILPPPTAPAAFPNGWSFLYGKTSFSLTPGQSGSTTLQVTSPTSLAAGNYDVTVRGTSWPNYLLETDVLATYVVNSTPVADFAVGVNPASISVPQNGNATTTVTVSLYGGYSQAVTFSTAPLPAGIHASFNPTGLPAPGSGTSTLTISADNTAAPGPTGISVQASDGTNTRSTPLTVTVTNTAPTLIGLTVSTTTPSIQVGGTAQFTANGIYSDTSTKDLTSVVAWDTSDHTVATVSTLGLVSGLKAGSVNVTAAYQGQTGGAPLQVTAPTTCTVANPTVTITPTTSPAIAAGTLQPYLVTVTNNNQACGTSMFILQLQPAPPAGWTAVLQYTSLQLADGAHGTSTLDVRSPVDAPAGTYDIFATALNWPNYNYKAQAQAEYVVSSVVVPSFTITAGKNAVSVQQGSSATVTVTSAGLNLFNAPVALSVIGLPNGVTGTLTPDANIPAPGSGSRTLNLSAASGATLGTVPITIQGSSGLETETATVNLTVSALPPSLVGISVTPSTPTVAMGTVPIQFDALGLYSDASSQDLAGLATWSSDNTSVATINVGSGLATIVGAGTANISASYLGKTGGTLLTVTAAATCTQANPTVTATPPSDGPGPAGRTAIYNVTITNNNTGCAASTFLLKPTAPNTDAWNIVLGKISFSLSPGQTASTTMQVTSPGTEPSGTYTIPIQGVAWPVYTFAGSTTVNYLIQ